MFKRIRIWQIGDGGLVVIPDIGILSLGLSVKLCEGNGHLSLNSKRGVMSRPRGER